MYDWDELLSVASRAVSTHEALSRGYPISKEEEAVIYHFQQRLNPVVARDLLVLLKSMTGA